MAVSAPTSGFVDPSGLSFEPPGSAMPSAGLLGMPGPMSGMLATLSGFGPMPALSVGSMSAPAPPAGAPPTSSGPPGYSYITGTVDPTAAEIVVAAGAAGMPIPTGMDPVMFSRMMSGDPTALALGPPPIPAFSAPPTSMPSMSSPAATFGAWSTPSISPLSAPVAPPPASMPSLMPTPIPLAIPKPIPKPMPIAASPRTAMAVSKPPTKIKGGAGPYIGCDPITGKCPPYR